MKIDQHTALYGVIGNPVRHSLSPALHNAAFSATGFNAVYLAFETGDIEEGSQSIVKLAYPQVDGGSASVAVASRFRLDNSIVYTTDINADDENRVSLRSIGKYHRLLIKPTGQWQTIMAVDIEIQPVSSR